MGARSAYLWLRIAELTAVPLTVFMAVYVLSGYGMLVPRLTALVGLSRAVSTYLHTHPLLRYATAVMVAIHGCCGLALLANRYARSRPLKLIIHALALTYALMLLTLSTAAELTLLAR